MQRRTICSALICLCTLGAALPAHADSARIIVKYRDSSDTQDRQKSQGRKSALSAQMGVNILDSREIGFGMEVLHAENISATELIEKMMARPDVEFAEEDRLNKPLFTPNDPLFSSQWYLGAAETSAIHATTAWNTTTGSNSVVVAVLDTGILANHPDLQANPNILQGYDFVTNTEIANDGDGRDSDPTDPGDWLTSSEKAASTLFTTNNCPVTDSSWHGSIVTGIIGAALNNSTGIAGLAPGVKILPVRVLGKCGGYSSDIIAGMAWAAGVDITGYDPSIPRNPNPAGILNLSLGASGSCSPAYQTAITELKAAGVLVVAAAGNDDSSVGSPANCTGVLAVGAVSNAGSKTRYSNFGSSVTLSAPGGNQDQAQTVCAKPIYSTRDAGLHGPTSSSYSDITNCEKSTSYATAMVSGVAALMLSVNPSLTPDLLTAMLKSSATTFPTTVSGVTASCVGKATGADTECLCTTTTCGAGMLNAANAVTAAMSYSPPSPPSPGPASVPTLSNSALLLLLLAVGLVVAVQVRGSEKTK